MKKQILAVSAVLGIAALVLSAGTLAYFTDKDTKTNIPREKHIEKLSYYKLLLPKKYLRKFKSFYFIFARASFI